MYKTFEKHESEVRSYCRNFPIKLKYAKNAQLISESGEKYIDFFAGAGAINYGHNNPYIKNAILEYLSEDTIIHALDMYTTAKEGFIDTFYNLILKPRNLDYKMMFCGSTGTNAVEAALKLARKYTGRSNVFAFSGAFHGMSLGSLSMTSDSFSRAGGGVSLNNVTFIPYSNQFGDYNKSIEYLEWVLSDDHSGIDKPAAIFLETVQAEGGVNVCDISWLKKLREICDKYEILLVCDDIQVGIGRTGTFFSFERAGVVPDIVVLSKSLSGFGLPMSMLLMRPEIDVFRPAEHNGTFRGNQLAFVGAKAAVEYYCANDLSSVVKQNSEIIENFIKENILPLNNKLSYRGIGMIWGIDFAEIGEDISKKVMFECVKNNLIIERAGRHDSVVKILPPLTIEKEKLMEGLNILKESVKTILK